MFQEGDFDPKPGTAPEQRPSWRFRGARTTRDGTSRTSTVNRLRPQEMKVAHLSRLPLAHRRSSRSGPGASSDAPEQARASSTVRRAREATASGDAVGKRMKARLPYAGQLILDGRPRRRAGLGQHHSARPAAAGTGPCRPAPCGFQVRTGPQVASPLFHPC